MKRVMLIVIVLLSIGFSSYAQKDEEQVYTFAGEVADGSKLAIFTFNENATIGYFTVNKTEQTTWAQHQDTVLVAENAQESVLSSYTSDGSIRWVRTFDGWANIGGESNIMPIHLNGGEFIRYVEKDSGLVVGHGQIKSSTHEVVLHDDDVNIKCKTTQEKETRTGTWSPADNIYPILDGIVVDCLVGTIALTTSGLRVSEQDPTYISPASNWYASEGEGVTQFINILTGQVKEDNFPIIGHYGEDFVISFAEGIALYDPETE
jgi:hypothetical protein